VAPVGGGAGVFGRSNGSSGNLLDDSKQETEQDCPFCD
jgi:hypothetical protein